MKRLRVILQENTAEENDYPRWRSLHSTTITDDTSMVIVSDALDVTRAIIESRIGPDRRES